MTGAHKLTLEDVEQLRELFREGHSNSRIAREFVSSTGQKITREHISKIRSGKRWNLNKHSFIVKEHLRMNDEIITEIFEDKFSTELSLLITKTGNYHIFLRSKNGIILKGMETPLMENKPSIEEMLNYHNHWIFDEISKI